MKGKRREKKKERKSAMDFVGVILLIKIKGGFSCWLVECSNYLL